VVLSRYPKDPYDRVWLPWSDSETWKEIGNDPQAWTGLSIEQSVQPVKEKTDLRHYAPSLVMQTAIVPRNGSRTIQLPWFAEPNHAYPDPKFIGIVYFAELAKNALRQFETTINGKLLSDAPYTPKYLIPDAFFDSEPRQGVSGHYELTLSATATSTLPPILNAAELFTVVSTTNVATDAKDGTLTNDK
jgi:hypothetical protein